MKAFASWSGGKDCMLAVHRFQKEPTNTIECLINMCNTDASVSRSHGISSHLINLQARAMHIPIRQVAAEQTNYREQFKKSIIDLKISKNISAGVFGDIYLKEHRVWIEALCAEIGIEAIFPLWGASTERLLEEFISEGFKSMVIAIDNTKLDSSYLGRVISSEFLSDIRQLEGVDVCAEKGEYHSFVFDGPNFIEAVPIVKSEIYTHQKNTFLKLKSYE